MQARNRALATALVAVIAVGVSATACASGGRSSFASSDGKLKIVTTVSPITSITANVVGDLADVRGLIPEGADSHTFEPPPSAAKILSEADLVFVNGLKLEDPTRDLARSNLKKGARVVELGTQAITPAQYIFDFSFPKEGGKPNPHLWTNPPYAKDYARIVRDALAARDPRNADAYRANYDRFAAKVDALDAAMMTATATVPKPELLTYHDAYAYFAEHYGWKVIGAIQVSSFEDPTPREVADLVRQIKTERVPAIFGSEVFPSKVLAQIGQETGVRYVDKLRDDDLPGRPGDSDHSWLGLMRSDFITMVASLGGDAAALQVVKVENAVPDKAFYPQ
jgi:ABC-type Zn uptake system ZnuABC Zn-binding protein ZnuA